MSATLSQSLRVRLREGVFALAIASIVLCASLGGCSGGFSTQESRIGPDDGTDPCRRELTTLDSTGNFFGVGILKGATLGAVGGGAMGAVIGRDWRGAALGALAGAAVGGAVGYWAVLQDALDEPLIGRGEVVSQVRSDLQSENEAISRTQAAFDKLAACRFQQAQTIRAAYVARQITRELAVAQMEQVSARSQRGIQLAKQIDSKLVERGAQFEVAADNLSPGPRREAEVEPAAASDSTPWKKWRPNPTGIGRASSSRRDREPVAAAQGNRATTEAAGNVERHPTPSAPEMGNREQPVAGSDADPIPIRTLASSNAARRDDFARSVARTEVAAARQFGLEQ